MAKISTLIMASSSKVRIFWEGHKIYELYVQLIIITQRLIPKICEYATQIAEAGSEIFFF